MVSGNYIGTDATGLLDRGNTAPGGRGIYIFNSANNTIGGTTAAERNVISGNDNEGLLLEGAGTTGNVIRGNYIGVKADLSGTLGNTAEGIQIFRIACTGRGVKAWVSRWCR